MPLNLVRKLPDCLNSRVRCSPKPTLPGACECCARLNNTWLRWLFVCPGTVGRRLCPPPPRSPPRGSGGGLKPSSAAKALSPSSAFAAYPRSASRPSLFHVRLTAPRARRERKKAEHHHAPLESSTEYLLSACSTRLTRGRCFGFYPHISPKPLILIHFFTSNNEPY